MFRDGVGDGQLNTVGSYEVPQMSECFALFGATYQPQLAVVVVHKRINTRIFSVEVNDVHVKFLLNFNCLVFIVRGSV